MKDSHAHLNITEKEWAAMVTDFRNTLDEFKVPAAEQEELVKIVEGTRADIVVDAKAASQQ
jgi:hemoglobin